MSKEITYEPINFKRLSDVTNIEPVTREKGRKVHRGRKKVELLADVATDVGVTHRRRMFKYIGNAIVVVVVALVILFRYTLIADNTAKISKLEKEFTAISEENINLQCSIDSKTDSDSIEEAATKLGMAQPSKSQKIAVNVVGGDYVEVAQSGSSHGEVSSLFYATIIETLGNVQEYLY